MRDIKAGEKYKHFKGNTVEVLMIARHSENLEELVIYEHSGEYWARPKNMFLDEKDISNREDNITHQKYRFELIEEEK